MHYPLQLFSIPRNTANISAFILIPVYINVLYDGLLLLFFRDLATLFSNTFKVKGKFHQEYKLYQIDKKKSVVSLHVA